MKSTIGRPRLVTDAQVRTILTWHTNRKTMAQLARELNLPVTTVARVIQCKGQFKQPSPEQRQAVVEHRRALRKRLSSEGWI